MMHSYYQKISTPTPSNWLSKILRERGFQNVLRKVCSKPGVFSKGVGGFKPQTRSTFQGQRHIYLDFLEQLSNMLVKEQYFESR